jgi:hypothetical protein
LTFDDGKRREAFRCGRALALAHQGKYTLALDQVKEVKGKNATTDPTFYYSGGKLEATG